MGKIDLWSQGVSQDFDIVKVYTITNSTPSVYADDCLVERCMKHKVYIVATNDKDLKRRIRKIPGVPIMSVARGMNL
jgi:rRNA-processing protein FCF1